MLLHFPPLGSWAHPSQASSLWAALLLQGVRVGFYQQNPDIHGNLVSLVLCSRPPRGPEILPTGPAGLFPWDFLGSLGGLDVLLAGRRVGGCKTSQPIRSLSRAGLPPGRRRELRPRGHVSGPHGKVESGNLQAPYFASLGLSTNDM